MQPTRTVRWPLHRGIGSLVPAGWERRYWTGGRQVTRWRGGRCRFIVRADLLRWRPQRARVPSFRGQPVLGDPSSAAVSP